MIEILRKVISCFTGMSMAITPPVCVYNAWRFINPIKIETSIQAAEYGDKMLKAYFPQKDLPGDQKEDYPYVDYRKYPVLGLNLNGGKWFMAYETGEEVSRVLFGCKPSSPIVRIDKKTGRINFPLREK